MRVAANLNNRSAKRIVDLQGLYVVPGLVDIHSHQYGYDGALFPDDVALPAGTTTVADAGGPGWRNFEDYREKILRRSKTRVLTFINIVGLKFFRVGAPRWRSTSYHITRAGIATLSPHRRTLVERIAVDVAHQAGCLVSRWAASLDGLPPTAWSAADWTTTDAPPVTASPRCHRSPWTPSGTTAFAVDGPLQPAMPPTPLTHRPRLVSRSEGPAGSALVGRDGVDGAQRAGRRGVPAATATGRYTYHSYSAPTAARTSWCWRRRSRWASPSS